MFSKSFVFNYDCDSYDSTGLTKANNLFTFSIRIRTLMSIFEVMALVVTGFMAPNAEVS